MSPTRGPGLLGARCSPYTDQKEGAQTCLHKTQAGEGAVRLDRFAFSYCCAADRNIEGTVVGLKLWALMLCFYGACFSERLINTPGADDRNVLLMRFPAHGFTGARAAPAPPVTSASSSFGCQLPARIAEHTQHNLVPASCPGEGEEEYGGIRNAAAASVFPPVTNGAA